jgi:isocitrate lyase
MIWAEFPSADPELPARFADAVHRVLPELPLYFNYSSNLKWHESGVKFDEVAAMGYKMMHVSLVAMRVMMQAFWDYAADMKARGAEAEIDFQKRLIGHPMGAFHELAGFSRIKSMEERYLPVDEVARKYSGATGL